MQKSDSSTTEIKQKKAKKKHKVQSSKLFCILGVATGFLMSQECLAVMVYAIHEGFSGTASWITAAVGMAQAVIITCISGYFSLCKVDHSSNGITFETAKANNFTTNTTDTASY